MEALSPTMEEGRVVKWLKQEGEPVTKGDVLAEVETDKAVMELVARGDGVLRRRLRGEGETAPVGELLGVIATPDENIDSLVGASATASAGAASAASGTGTAESASAVVGSLPQSASNGGSEPATVETGRRRASPLARRLASERGVDLSRVHGSGPGGRIVRRDLEGGTAAAPNAPPPAASFAPAAPSGSSAPRTVQTTSAITQPPVARSPSAPQPGAPAAPSAPSAPAAPSIPGVAGGAGYRDVPLTQIRKTIAKRLAESIGPVPTFYLTAEFDVERLAEMRQAMAALGDAYKVSYNDIMLKAVATALAQHPEVNAHWLGDRIRYFDRIHLGVAVAVEDGLITPVIFDADRKSLRTISTEARELAGRARERRLRPEEYTGSTFSVSNLGMFGIDQFTAIINPPEAGILAIGAVEAKPVAGEDGQLSVRKRMRVTMSCDHRVIDGATGARFLQALSRMIENPLMLTY